MILQRIKAKIDFNGANGCWIWLGCKTPTGYGQYTIVHGTSPVYVHRLVYEMLKDNIKDGLEIDHLCRNRACVNPDHLQPVPHRENLLRGNGFSGQQRRQTHCKHGHEFTLDNTYHSPSRPDERVCRICCKKKSKRLRDRRITEWFLEVGVK